MAAVGSRCTVTVRRSVLEVGARTVILDGRRAHRIRATRVGRRQRKRLTIINKCVLLRYQRCANQQLATTVQRYGTARVGHPATTTTVGRRIVVLQTTQTRGGAVSQR